MSTIATGVARGLSLRQQMEEVLAADIISGATPPGELLTVPVLAQTHAVSATPVREAMLSLERRGFVDPVRNKGFRVREVGQEELSELVRVRVLLEAPSMIDVAAIFATADRAPFDQLVGLIRRAAADRDFLTYVRADKEFHLGLLALLGNTVLVRMVSDLRDQTRTTGIASTISPDKFAASIEEHAQLMDLLVDGDGVAAAALMERHVGHVLGWWSGREE